MNKILMSLTQIIGQHVQIENETDVEGIPGRVRIHAHGKLEAPCDDGEYYVRIGEDPNGHGCNGIAFPLDKVVDVSCQPSGIWAITLRG